jgi:hypothetical protein
MTKSFKTYLAESIRTYNYKIKLAGELDKNWVDLFCMNLQKFDPVKISAPKSTPIQQEPYGFPGLTNQAITIIDVEFRYPATEIMVKQLARLLNFDENSVRMVTTNYDGTINDEADAYSNQMNHSPILNHTELEDNGKDANKAYGDQYLTSIKKQMEADQSDRDEMPYAAPKTKPGVDMRTLPGNPKSPMTQIHRPGKPETSMSVGFKRK